MKTIIAGCRTFNDYELLKSKVNYHRDTHVISEVVSGGAEGADYLGERYADEMFLNLKIIRADWKTHGRAAGPIRNKQMADYADCLIAVWDGKSKGTKNMIDTMNKLKKPVYIIWIGDNFVAS
jgi:predicted nucleic-acid-binding protein